jgi:hypothetical protein
MGDHLVMTQIPLRIYFAVLPANRQTFADCLSGNLSEASIRLKEISTGDEWWGSNGGLYYQSPNEINRTCLNQALAWFLAIGFQADIGVDSNNEPITIAFPDGIIVDGNAPITVPGSPDPGFEVFIAACGLELWTDANDPAPPNGNGT